MLLAQHSLDLRKEVKKLKLNPYEFDLQSESYINALPLSSQEKLAVERVFSARMFKSNSDDKLKMMFWQ